MDKTFVCKINFECDVILLIKVCKINWIWVKYTEKKLTLWRGQKNVLWKSIFLRSIFLPTLTGLYTTLSICYEIS